jgi:CubicO group peptidase (beta-lactamase class C family)
MNLTIRPKKICITFFVILLFNSTIWSGDLDNRLDNLFVRWERSDSPGCALAVVKDGRIIYKKGYGMANLELDVPIRPDSVFYIGSVSKQFVAFCVALLVEQSKLSLDDDIRKYLPEMPDYGSHITLRHLIHHTGGIRDYLELEDIAGIPFGMYHEKEALNLICRQKKLNFVPGEESSYSNSGYFLLGVIVKRVSGKSLREFADENIFGPLNMKNSRFHDNYAELVEKRATGYYDRGGGEYRNFISTFDCVGSGGLFTSVEDLFLWDQNFYHHRVGGKAVMDLMHTQGVLNDGTKLDYAFGLIVGEYRGLRVVEHGGSLGGYRADMLRFPDQRFSVILLSNLSSFNPSRLVREVADICLTDEFKEEQIIPARKQVEKPDTIDFPKERLTEYVGQFYSEEILAGFEIALMEGHLYIKRDGNLVAPLDAVSKDKFRVRGWSIQFICDEEKQISGFRLSSGRVRNLLFERHSRLP